MEEKSGLLPNRWQAYVGILTESTVYKNQRWFHIFVPEFLPTKTGDVSVEDASFKVDLYNILTKSNEQSQVSVTCTIYADYFGTATGFDVPTMYRGMQVLVINYGTTDKWYWIPLERDDSYKTFEHQRVSCADIAQTNKTAAEKDDIEARDKGLTDDNTYYMEIDTKYRKHIKISTSASDGEEFRYFIEIDAEAHSIEIWDNCVDGTQPNNTIKIESRPESTMLGRITLQNASNNSIVMAGQDTMVNIPRNLVINVGGDTMFNCAGNVAENITKCFSRIVGENEATTVTGMTEHIHVKSKSETCKENKIVTIGQTLKETYTNRTSQGTNTTLQSNNYNATASSVNFKFNSFSGVYQTVSQNCAKAWSLMTRAWSETASSVGGSVVALIRGGHH